ncbi:hypothetical protein MALU111345_01520 [Marinicrinis lubricantis]
MKFGMTQLSKKAAAVLAAHMMIGDVHGGKAEAVSCNNCE